MNKISKILLAILIVVGSGFCRNTWDSGIHELEPMYYDDEHPEGYVPGFYDNDLPVGATARRHLIVSDNGGNYLPIPNCSDIADATNENFKPGVFTPVQLLETFHKYSEINTLTTDIWHWYGRYKLTYIITCGNHVTYRGVVEWQTYNHRCRNFCDEKETYGDDEAKEIDLSTYNPTTFFFTTTNGTISEDNDNKIPVAKILHAWNGRPVELPKFKSGTAKMDVPVLMIPGFRSDYYDTWGVTVPNTDKFSPEFRNGQVTGYTDGSFPDIMARYRGLDVSENGINKNGIYFFNAPLNADGSQVEPYWTEDPTNSISRALYEKLSQTLTDFYGLDWQTDANMMIDLVGHSQGGLIVREMLRALSSDASTANPANHIRKLVTVNTPHLGTPLTDPLDEIKKNTEYSSLVRIVEDTEDQLELEKAHPITPTLEEFVPKCEEQVKKMLFLGDIDIDCVEEWYKMGVANSSKELVSATAMAHLDLIAEKSLEAGMSAWVEHPWLNIFVPAAVAAPVTIPTSFLVGTMTSVKMRIRGNIIGDYEIQTAKTYPILGTRHEEEIISNKTLKDIRFYLTDGRERGKHLGSTSKFIQDMKKYPTLPNGKNLVLQPLYSYNVSALKSYILNQIQENATEICASEDGLDTEDYCLDATKTLLQYAQVQESVTLKDFDKLDETVSAVNLFMQQWLSKSDLLVPVESQTFGYNVDENGNVTDNPNSWANVPEFHKPRKYNIYLSTVPDIAPMNMVIHGYAPTEMSGSIDVHPIHTTFGIPQLPAASLMGLDILCALRDDVCPGGDEATFLKVPQIVAAGVVKTLDGTEKNVAVQSLDLTNNFNIKPVYQSSDFQGVGIKENDETIVVAAYDLDKGTYVWYKDANGQEHIQVLSDNATRWQTSIERKENTIIVTALSNDGEKKTFTVPVSITSTSVSVQVYGDEGATSVVAFMGGTGTATDPSTQERPTVPTNRKDQITGDIAVAHYEAGQSEKNTSRPRIIVGYGGSKPLHGFKVAYYFTADPARGPVAEIDYPNYPIAVEHLGGDQWRFVLDLSNETLEPMSLSPNPNGYQIRLHYSDWSDWNHRFDYSADMSNGTIQLNDKIVVYDTEGNILWGVPPTLPRTQMTLEKKSVELTWRDAGEHETNNFKPEFTLKNTGNTDLKNYTVRFYLRAPEGKTFTAEDWFTPEADPSISAIAPNVWKVELTFDKHILYAGQQVFSGNIGIHLEHWEDFSKEMLGLVVIDETGDIIWGNSWNGSGVVPQYMISFFK